MRTVYLNGEFVPEAEATLSIYDLSVMQACAAFEMTRSFHGEHFKLKEHITRLIQSCDLLSIPIPDGDWYEVIDKLTYLNPHGPGEEHRLLIVVSPGCAPMYRELEGVIPHPFIYIADFPLRYTVAGFGQYFTEGVQCVTSQIQQVPDACVPSQAKHRSRLHFHLAQQQAPPGTWPLLTREVDDGTHGGGTLHEYLEAPGANLVMVDSGEVLLQRSNALPGISMQTVQELTGAKESHFDEFCYLRHADELWLTGTPFFALPVVSLDGKPIGDGQIGPHYRAMMEKANKLVGLDIAQQICDWDGPRIWTPDVERARAIKFGA